MKKENSTIEELYDHFPSYVSDYLKEATISIGSDPSYALTIFLAVASACIGKSVKVQLSNTWSEYTGIFSVIVGTPSAKKSPMLSAISLPLETLSSMYIDEYDKQLEKFRKAKREKEADNLTQPILKTVYTTNTTVEALAKLLKENPIGILLFKDELTHSFKQLNAYKSGGGDLEEILELYNNKPISVTRKTSEAIRTKTPFFSIVGGMQPAPFIDVFSKSTDNGLKERFIYGFSNVQILERRISEIDVSQQTIDNYINGLLALRFQSEQVISKDKCRIYKLSSDAEEFWKHWVTTLPIGTDVDAMYGKMEARAPRIASILHTLKNPLNNNNQIELETMESAIEITSFYILSHKQAVRLFDEGEIKEKIDKAVAWLRSCYRNKKYLDVVDDHTGPKITTFTNNEITGVKNTIETKKILGLLSDRGYGYFKKSRSKQYPKEIFCLFRQYR